MRVYLYNQEMYDSLEEAEQAVMNDFPSTLDDDLPNLFDSEIAEIDEDPEILNYEDHEER